MKNFKLQKGNLATDNKIDALKLQKSVKGIEDRLKQMGIERPRRGHRISDPAHGDKTQYPFW